MRLTSAFKLNKEAKRVSSNILDAHERGSYIKQMIDAQLNEEAARRQPLNKKDKE